MARTPRRPGGGRIIRGKLDPKPAKKDKKKDRLEISDKGPVIRDLTPDGPGRLVDRPVFDRDAVTGPGRPGLITDVDVTPLTPEQLSALFDALPSGPAAPTVPQLSVRPLTDRPVLRPGVFTGTLAQAQNDFKRLRSDCPVLMFPVRIETRFAASNTKLRIRLYPDQASIDGFDPRLTAQEMALGNALAKDLREAGGDQAARLALWHQFAAMFEPFRAAHIARAALAGQAKGKPRDPEDQPPARAPLLPDRWFVTGYANGQVAFDDVTNRVNRAIRFSPDLTSVTPTAGDVAVDPALKWMFDYDEAVTKGMAITVDLPDFARDEVEEIFVLGALTKDPVRPQRNMTPARGAEMLEDLFEAQLYEWGAGFAPQGMATNNTSDVETGWSSREIDLDDVFRRMVEPVGDLSADPPAPVATDETLMPAGRLEASQTQDSAAVLMARTLGLAETGALARFEHRQLDEDGAMKAMNALLWLVSWGEYFGTLLSQDEGSYFRPETIEWLRRKFIDDVRGGACLPTLRLGHTPYGVLPVRKLGVDRWPHNPGEERLRRLMLSHRLGDLMPEWEAAANDVIRIDPGAGASANASTALLQILRQSAHPARYSQSALVSERGLTNFLYDLRDLLVNPASNATLVPRVFPQGSAGEVRIRLDYGFGSTTHVHHVGAGLSDYDIWPDTFRDGEHQRTFLTGQIATLQRLRADDVYRLDTIDDMNAAVDTDAYDELEQRLRERQGLIDQMIGHLEFMIDLCVEHAERNAVFDYAMTPPKTLYSGVLGAVGNDPRMAYLSVDPDLAQWHPDTHVLFPRGDATIGVAAQFAYLADYARSFLSDAVAPDEPTFPDGKKPLLYRLLKEAIYRTGTDEDASVLPLRDIIEAGVIERETSVTAQVGSVLSALDTGGVRTLVTSVRSVRGLSRGAQVPRAQEAVARTLRQAAPGDLTLTARALDAEIASRAGDATFPVAEMRDLSRELRSLDTTGGAVLRDLTFARTVPTRSSRINEMVRALDRLAGLNADQIELLMSQTLGLASTRLDAWITSIPAREIADLRAPGTSTRSGIQIGAFGWVQKLKPNRESGENVQMMRSQGFIHTPSLNHARTAAVLRSGWNTYGSQEEDSAMAVNLSSARMRDAKWIAQALRDGQDLGDILGARFERLLKDRLGGAHWIYPIRQAVLVLTGEEIDPTQPGVDGLDLQRIWRLPTGPKDLKAKAVDALIQLGGKAKSEDFSPVELALKQLEVELDSLADAAVADSVHALVQGNLSRAGATAAAVSDGSVAPPDFDVLHSTPAARGQVHRVALLPAQQGAEAAWRAARKALPLALADPQAEEIAADLLGDPHAAVFELRYLDAKGTELNRTRLSWGDMLEGGSPFAASALQTVMLVPTDGFGENTPMARRVLADAMVRPPVRLPQGATVEFAFSKAGRAALDDVLDRWAGWRAVIGDARALAPRDLAVEDGEGGMQMALGDLEKRAKAAEHGFIRALKPLLAALPEPQEGDAQPVGKAAPAELLRNLDMLTGFGIEEAVSAEADRMVDQVDAYARAWAVAPILRRRMKALRAVPTLDKSADGPARAKAARQRLAAIFGMKVPGICRLRSAGLKEVTSGFAASAKRIQAADSTPQAWIERMGYVRPALRALSEAILIDGCTGQREAVAHVTQWPENGKMRPWIAAAPPPDEEGPRHSLLVFTASGAKISPSDELGGLIVDEVVDRIPASTAQTGAALHYDAPSTEAPQTFLLAMPPHGLSWSYDLMADTVRDAYRLALIRGVGGHSMSRLNQVLPAIYNAKYAPVGGEP